MTRIEDKDTRYFIDLDLETQTLLGWDFGNRFELVKQKPASPAHHRVFLTKGQWNKLVTHALELES